MKHVLLAMRLVAVSLALLVLGLSILDLGGWFPLHSDTEVPSFAKRLQSQVPALFLSLVLLMPQACCRHGLRRRLLLAAHGLLALMLVLRVASDAMAYASGQLHVAAVVVGSVLLVIVLANALVLQVAGRHE